MKDLIEKYVGKEGTIALQRPKGISMNVRIVDVKEQYGKLQWLVTPLSGSGSGWVAEDPLKPAPIEID